MIRTILVIFCFAGLSLPSLAGDAPEYVSDPAYHPKQGDKAILYESAFPIIRVNGVLGAKNSSIFEEFWKVNLDPENTDGVSKFLKKEFFVFLANGTGVLVLEIEPRKDDDLRPEAVVVRTLDGPYKGEKFWVAMPDVNRPDTKAIQKAQADRANTLLRLGQNLRKSRKENIRPRLLQSHHEGILLDSASQDGGREDQGPRGQGSYAGPFSFPSSALCLSGKATGNARFHPSEAKALRLARSQSPSPESDDQPDGSSGDGRRRAIPSGDTTSHVAAAGWASVALLWSADARRNPLHASCHRLWLLLPASLKETRSLAMRSSLLMLFLGLVLVGCGPTFKGESDELEYLEALSNPSVSQFQRRKELQEKRENLSREMAEAQRVKDQQLQRAEENRTIPQRSQAALEDARGWEGVSTRAAILRYEAVAQAQDFAGTPAAAEAAKRMEVLKSLPADQVK